MHGEDPALFIAGFEYLPDGQSEYEFAGAIKGAPIEVCDGPQTGLPIPASAEIIFEGRLLPMSEATLPEGPFGEFTGYYAAEARPGPVMEVTAIHHRNDPILLGSPPMKPPRFHFGLPFRAATIWSNLEAAGVTDVVGAWQHVSQLMTVVALRQRYDGHAKRAALVAAAHSYMARIVVVVDEDIDPSNLADVMWAVDDPLRAGGRHRHHAQCLELGARSAHPARRQGARRHLALEGDHQRLPAVRLDRQISAALGAFAGGGARDRGEVGRHRPRTSAGVRGPSMSKSSIIRGHQARPAIIRGSSPRLGSPSRRASAGVRMPANRITQIVHGKRAITGDTALRLGHWSPARSSAICRPMHPRRGCSAHACQRA